MAKTPTAAQAVQTQTIKFKMDGLNIDYTADDQVFSLTTDMKQLNLAAVFDTLVEQGISEHLADQATAQLGEFIFSRQLGEHFAKNMKRVG